MQVKKIAEQIAKFKTYLDSPKAYDTIHWWESQWLFQQNWDVLAANFAAMYDASLQNSQTKRLWKRETYYPKQMMLQLIAMESDFVQQIFKDFFDEKKSIDGRVDRFQFYCDELLQLYKKANPRSIENNHYHTNETCFLYLAFRYPSQYGFYNFKDFQRSLTLLGSMKVPQLDDVLRFTKVTNTLWKFLIKDGEILDLHQKRLQEGKHYMEDSMLLVSEWMKVMT